MTKKYRDWSISLRLRAIRGRRTYRAVVNARGALQRFLPVTSDQLISREVSFFPARVEENPEKTRPVPATC